MIVPGDPALEERLARLSPAKRALLERRLRASAGDASSQAIPVRAEGGSVPLTFSQTFLWELERAAPGLCAYNVPRAVRLRGRLDLAALRCAFDRVVERHRTLRSRIVFDGDAVRAVVDPAPEGLLETVDLGSLGEGCEAALVAELAREADRLFELASGRLVRAKVFRLGPDDHALIVVWHHIAADESSARIFFDDLCHTYARRRTAIDDALPAPALHYADFAAWQRAYWSPSRIETLAREWNERLRPGEERRALPTDRARPALPTFSGTRNSYTYSAPWVRDFLRVGATHGCTPFVTLLAAHATLLHRYTGDRSVTVGTVVSGRGRKELDGIMGYFSNVLAIPIDFDDRPTFVAVLERVRDTLTFAMERRDVPFDALVAAAAAGSPLAEARYETMFSMTRDDVPNFAGLDVARIALGVSAVKLDLAVGAIVTDGTIRFDVDYRTQIFDGATIDRMFENAATLCEGIAIDPNRPVATLPILGVTERAMLARRNATAMPYARDETVIDLIDEQIERTPQAIALLFGSETLTYAELGVRTRRLASYLRARGIGSESIVALCLERSIDTVVTMLAVLRAGGAYLPLDPRHPSDRIAGIVRDARPVLTIVHDTVRDLLPDDCRVLSLDAERDAIAASDPQGARVAFSRASLAYVIYTSGSTGLPKGVAIEHRQLSNFVAGARAAIEIGPSDTILAIAPIVFDIAGFDTYLGLTTGAKVAIVPTATASDGFALRELARAMRPTIVQATPSTWSQLVEAGWQGDAALRIIAVGETLTPRLAGDLLSRAGAVWNAYGPTEATIWATLQRIVRGRAVTIGFPMANVSAYVLDAMGEHVATGVAGELYLGGEGIARGYLQRPALTAERFVPDRFAEHGGARLYRTGDRARIAPNGELEFLGRVDFQVKLRGHRIELGEIEHAIAAQAGVTACVALLAGRDADARVVAFCSAAEGFVAGEALTRSVRLAAARVLPKIMIPATFAWLDTWPLGTNGKLDRQALERLVPAAVSEVSTHRGQTATDTEEGVRRIFSAMLGHEQFALDDDFFNVGGHSILAMRVLVRVGTDFGVRLPLATLFDRPTVAAIAKLIDAATVLPSLQLSPQGRVTRSVNPLHQLLASMLETMVGTSGIGYLDDFFAIGGTPELAYRLLQKIDRELGVAIPYEKFLERPTVSALARLATEAIAPSASNVTAFNATGSLPPFFFLHWDLQGGGLYVRRFVRAVDPERPFFVMEPPDPQRSGSIADIARDAIGALRKVAPHGPYVLGGYCAGGIIAFEMAQQLRAAGDTVIDVIAIDAARRNTKWTPVAERLDAWASRAARNGSPGTRACARIASAELRTGALLSRASWWLRVLRRDGVRGIARKLRGSGIESDYAPQDDAALVPLWLARVAAYVPKRYDGRLTLLVSEQQLRTFEATLVRRWRRVAPHARFHSIDGDHQSCITRHGERTAALLAHVLSGDG